MPQSRDRYSAEQVELRIASTLRGAFGGPPTPLKDIPKKNGGLRRVSKKNPSGTKSA